MTKLLKKLHLFDRYNTKCVTKVLNYIGAILILFALLIVLEWIHIQVPHYFSLTLATISSILLAIYYFCLDLNLGVALALFLIILNVIACLLGKTYPNMQGLEILLITLVGGIVLQALGYLYEGKKPTWAIGLWQIIIAPVYLFAELFFRCGYKLDLKQKLAEMGEGKS